VGEGWGPSWRGWIVLIVLLAFDSYAFFLTIFLFLTVTHRVDSDVFVVEGWIREYAIQAAVEEYHLGGYRRLFTTGVRFPGTAATSMTFAELLQKFRIPGKSVEVVPSSSQS
jgi:hypothetical protein